MVTSHQSLKMRVSEDATAPIFPFFFRRIISFSLKSSLKPAANLLAVLLALVLLLVPRHVYSAPAFFAPYQQLTQQQCLSIVQQVFQQTATDPDPASRWEKRLSLLRPYKSTCYLHADFLSALGTAELNTGRLSDAQDTLERTLMVQPDNGDALVNYAQVLDLLGQPFAAYDLNRQLLKRTDLPDDVARFLKARDKLWASRFTRTDYRLSAAIGYDSNLNTAADLSSLTLGDGNTLVLDEESRPISGSVFHLNASVKNATLLEDGMRVWQGNLYTRTGTEARLQQQAFRHDQQQLDIHFKRFYYSRGKRARKLKGTLAWGVTGRQFWYNDTSLYQSVDLELEHRQPLAADCAIESDIRLSRQHYPDDNDQDALDHRLQIGFECQVSPALMLYSQLGLAFNRALYDRTGGDRRVRDLILAAQYRQDTGRLWSLSGRYALTEDATGYSDQLDQGNARYQYSLQVTGQLRQPLTPDLDLELSVTKLTQTSNIILYEYEAEKASLALNWQF